MKLIFSFCPDEILFKEYNSATVFVQASITEGMSNTLNEAMLCGCIPVGSNVNGIPDVIGDTGILVMKRDVAELETATRQALSLNSGDQATLHILSNFTLQLREDRVLKVFRELI